MTDNEEKDDVSLSTLLLFIIVVPIIAYLLFFAYQKSTQAEGRAKACSEQCIADGYAGHEFRWSVFSGPKCSCLN